MNSPDLDSRLDPSILTLLETVDLSAIAPLARSNQGEVRRYQHGDLDLAIKSPSGRGLLRWLRRQSLRREYRIYRSLEGLSGFAPCRGFIGDRLILDYIEGSELCDTVLVDRGAFFDRLLATIQAMHERGIAHGDLKRQENLRITGAQEPVILDLGTAVMYRPGAGALNRKLFEFLRQTDLNAWVKLKYGGYAEIAEEDRHIFRRTWPERWLSRWWPGRR